MVSVSPSCRRRVVIDETTRLAISRETFLLQSHRRVALCEEMGRLKILGPQHARSFEQLRRLRELALGNSRPAVVIDRLEKRRVELHCKLELPLSFGEAHAQGMCQSRCEMRLGEIGTKLEGPAARGVALCKILLARVAVHVKQRAAVGEACISESVVGVDLDRPPEHLPGVFEPAPAPLMNELSSAQVVFVGLHVDGPVALYRFLLALAEYHAQRVEYRQRNFILDGEHVLHIPVEAL